MQTENAWRPGCSSKSTVPAPSKSNLSSGPVGQSDSSSKKSQRNIPSTLNKEALGRFLGCTLTHKSHSKKQRKEPHTANTRNTPRARQVEDMFDVFQVQFHRLSQPGQAKRNQTSRRFGTVVCWFAPTEKRGDRWYPTKPPTQLKPLKMNKTLRWQSHAIPYQPFKPVIPNLQTRHVIPRLPPVVIASPGKVTSGCPNRSSGAWDSEAPNHQALRCPS